MSTGGTGQSLVGQQAELWEQLVSDPGKYEGAEDSIQDWVDKVIDTSTDVFDEALNVPLRNDGALSIGGTAVLVAERGTWDHEGDGKNARVTLSRLLMHGPRAYEVSVDAIWQPTKQEAKMLADQRADRRGTPFVTRTERWRQVRDMIGRHVSTLTIRMANSNGDTDANAVRDSLSSGLTLRMSGDGDSLSILPAGYRQGSPLPVGAVEIHPGQLGFEHGHLGRYTYSVPGWDAGDMHQTRAGARDNEVALTGDQGRELYRVLAAQRLAALHTATTVLAHARDALRADNETPTVDYR